MLKENAERVQAVQSLMLHSLRGPVRSKRSNRSTVSLRSNRLSDSTTWGTSMFREFSKRRSVRTICAVNETLQRDERCCVPRVPHHNDRVRARDLSVREYLNRQSPFGKEHRQAEIAAIFGLASTLR